MNAKQVKNNKLWLVLARFDSKIEKKFTRDFSRAAKVWDLIREPDPIEAGGALIFSDFLFRDKQNPHRIWLLEIVGFWMPEYLERKMALLRKAALDNFILCIDDSLNCSDIEIPKGARVIRFKKSIDPKTILKIIKAKCS